MSDLHQAVRDYLAVRRALGYKLITTGRLLPDFVRFVEQNGSTVITIELAMLWATLPSNASPTWWAARLDVIRRFATYMRALDPRTEVPALNLLPHRIKKIQPYMYTEADVSNLMAVCSKLNGPLMPSTYATLFGLLYVTGMRVGEAIGMDCTDLDEHNSLLVIHNSKFGKSRELMLHNTTVQELMRYTEVRNSVIRCPKSPAFFLSQNGTRLHYKNVHFKFSRLRQWAGLSDRTPRPRIHDLRHSFAVTTLMKWYQDDRDVQALLPRLSTYLGHVNPISTYWYLTAVPELLVMAADRLDTTLGELP